MSLSLHDLSTGSCLLGVTVAAVIAIALYKRREAALTSNNGVPLPPGPPARWFWDSAIPTVNVSRTLGNLVAQYGPVVSFRSGSQVTIVIGRVEAAMEIMEKEGAALVDRPRMIAAAEIQARNLRFLFLRNSERLRRYRKVAHTHLQPKATMTYQHMQMEYARNVIMDILNDPKNHQAHALRFSASVMLHVAYGRLTPASKNDPDVIRMDQVNKNFDRTAHPGAFLVDQIPMFRYIPGYGRQLKEYHDFELEFYNSLMRRVESEMEKNQGGNCFMRSLLENIHVHGLSRDEMAYLAGDLYGAGTGTTAASITCLIVAAACHPEAQRRVQDQLDTIVGKDRLPAWQDFELLTQVRAFVLEAVRWRPTVPIGFAHQASRDIIWRGQWIPAGATVLGCHWAISRDPAAFPDPENFDPQRWIDDNGQIRNDMSAFTYGFGRRVCLGQYVANKSLYINLALLLWSFRIVERQDAPIDRNAFPDAIVSYMPPFEVDFIPRMEESWLREMVSEPVM